MDSKKKTSYAAPLATVGLNESETLVYVHLVENGSAVAKDLVRKLPIPRTLLYHVLRELERKGLVSGKKHAVDAWRTLYRAEDPKKVYELLAKKEKEFLASKNSLLDTVPKLVRDFSKHGNWPVVETLDDVSSYAVALEDLLTHADGEIFSYEDPTLTFAGADVRAQHERRRITRKILKKVLCKASAELSRVIADRPYDSYTEFRTLPKGTDLQLKPLLLAGNTVLLSQPSTHEPCVVRIVDDHFTSMQGSIFLHLWENATPATLTHIHV